MQARAASFAPVSRGRGDAVLRTQLKALTRNKRYARQPQAFAGKSAALSRLTLEIYPEKKEEDVPRYIMVETHLEESPTRQLRWAKWFQSM